MHPFLSQRSRWRSLVLRIILVLKVKNHQKVLEIEHRLISLGGHGSSYRKGQFEAIISNTNSKRRNLGCQSEWYHEYFNVIIASTPASMFMLCIDQPVSDFRTGADVTS